MDYMPDKIYFKDRASHYLQVSGAMARAFGKQHPLELFGRSDADFFSVEHAEQTFKDEQRIIETGKPMLDFVEKETWPDGSVTWVSTTKLPLHNAQGETIGTFGLSRDITDRRRAEEQLARYAEELRRRNVELENDLEMARELQSALMPRRYPSFPQSVETQESALQFSHFFTASSMVSGDFFDILRLSDTSAGIFICDVMGHGVRAALVAAIVRTLLGELKATGEDPGQFMHELNRKLVAILRQADDPMFVSASYVVADLAKGELRYANAGHPDAVRILHHGPTAEAVPLNRCSRGPVLGMFETAEYGSSTSELRPADVVLQFTDGLFEVEGADGALYDQRSLMEAVSRRGNLRAGELCREVLAEVRQFSASKQFSDDVCLVAAEVNRLISV
jgi:sigma-B regulation protein RsbU (phosphoserine phosphatase)